MSFGPANYDDLPPDPQAPPRRLRPRDEVRVTPRHRLLLRLVGAWSKYSDGWCHANNARLRKKLGCSESTLVRLIADLRALGVIEWDPGEKFRKLRPTGKLLPAVTVVRSPLPRRILDLVRRSPGRWSNVALVRALGGGDNLGSVTAAVTRLLRNKQLYNHDGRKTRYLTDHPGSPFPPKPWPEDFFQSLGVAPAPAPTPSTLGSPCIFRNKGGRPTTWPRRHLREVHEAWEATRQRHLDGHGDHPFADRSVFEKLRPPSVRRIRSELHVLIATGEIRGYLVREKLEPKRFHDWCWVPVPGQEVPAGDLEDGLAGVREVGLDADLAHRIASEVFDKQVRQAPASLAEVDSSYQRSVASLRLEVRIDNEREDRSAGLSPNWHWLDESSDEYLHGVSVDWNKLEAPVEEQELCEARRLLKADHVRKPGVAALGAAVFTRRLRTQMERSARINAETQAFGKWYKTLSPEQQQLSGEEIGQLFQAEQARQTTARAAGAEPPSCIL